MAAGSGDSAEIAIAHHCSLPKRKGEWTAVEPTTLNATDASESARRVAALSQRERQVLDAVLAGRPKRALATELGLTKHTVESYRARMLTRLNVGTLAEATRIGALAKFAVASAAPGL